MSLLVAFDFSNLLMRNASNPYNIDTDDNGNVISGVTGAVRKIRQVINDEKPDKILVALDPDDGQGFRKELSPAYKAHRKAVDDNIRYQFEIGRKVLKTLGWPSLAVSRFEADDVIASAVKAHDGRSLVVSGDKDLLALSSEETVVRLLRPGTHVDVTPDECVKLMGVTPRRVRDLKSLVGDTSDGVVGVPGIGQKTALKVLERYGSVGRMYQVLDQHGELEGISKAMTNRLIDGRDDARLSFKLVTLVDDLTIDIPLEYRVEQPVEVLDQLEADGLTNLAKVFDFNRGRSNTSKDGNTYLRFSA